MAGCFTMGSPASEDCREHYGKKETAHQVTLTHDFEISATETTRAEFQILMAYLLICLDPILTGLALRAPCQPARSAS